MLLFGKLGFEFCGKRLRFLVSGDNFLILFRGIRGNQRFLNDESDIIQEKIIYPDTHLIDLMLKFQKGSLV